VSVSISTLLNLSIGYILRAYIESGFYMIIMNRRESLSSMFHSGVAEVSFLLLQGIASLRKWSPMLPALSR